MKSYTSEKNLKSQGLDKTKSEHQTTGNQFLLAIDKCLTRMPNMWLNMLEQSDGTICESRIGR